ncbi:MAG: hypothetical protein WC444_04710 [Candidatus Paceibacterota bacterium]
MNKYLLRAIAQLKKYLEPEVRTLRTSPAIEKIESPRKTIEYFTDSISSGEGSLDMDSSEFEVVFTGGWSKEDDEMISNMIQSSGIGWEEYHITNASTIYVNNRKNANKIFELVYEQYKERGYDEFILQTASGVLIKTKDSIGPRQIE